MAPVTARVIAAIVDVRVLQPEVPSTWHVFEEHTQSAMLCTVTLSSTCTDFPVRAATLAPLKPTNAADRHQQGCVCSAASP